MAAGTRALEWLFLAYFLTHIPITLLVDLQALLPGMYPQSLTAALKWYVSEFKDPLMTDPPPWFLAMVSCEAFFQLPFFFVATYAFFKGSCRWIRTPAIIYATHVITTLVILGAHILFSDFSKSKHAAPETLSHRLTLLSIYAPYFLIPLMLLLTMLFNPIYNTVEKRKKK